MLNPIENRRWRLIAIISLTITTIAIITILTLIIKLSNKQTIKYVEFSSSQNFGFKVLESSQITKTQKEIISLNQLKQYIKARTEIILKENEDGNIEIDQGKINLVKAFSNTTIFQEYINELTRIQNEANFTTRKVKIINAIKQEEGKYFFTIKLIDHYKYKQEPQITKFSLYIKFKFVSTNLIQSTALKHNPLGLQIHWYASDNNNI
jgi:hypothetical protein